jgi:hypothetical protein
MNPAGKIEEWKMNYTKKDLELMDSRMRRYSNCFGVASKISTIQEETANPTDAVVCTFPPIAGRPFHTLVTNGMSNRQQPERVALGLPPRTEIMIYAKEPRNWMYSVLLDLAGFPFNCKDTFLGYGHTLGGVMPKDCIYLRQSLLTSGLLVVPCEKKWIITMTVDGDKTNMLLFVPITTAEFQHSETRGLQSLGRLFEKSKLDLVIDEGRQCMVSGSKPS